MDPITGAALIGGGSMLLGGLMGSSAQKKANRANIKLQREQQAWEERMSGTAYQRAVQDMLKAGVNPMLAISQGGASTPNVSAATVEPVDQLARGVASAGDKAMQAVTLQNVAINNDILRQKLEQERMNTNRQRVVMGEASVVNPDTGEVLHGERPWFMNELQRGDSETKIKRIEQALAEETYGYNVSSARALADLRNKEVTIAEIRAMLMQLEIPEKEAMAKWFDTVGAASPAAKAGMTVLQWLRFMFNK